jgi:transposase-like protein
VSKIAKDLGISESCLRNWMAQAGADDKGSQVKLTSTEEKAATSYFRAGQVRP